MGLLNLALGQMLGLFLPVAGLLVALYFYDRSRRRVLVSTLRFWPRRPAPPVRQRHRRVQHPLSLLLQLAALLLLLLAIADPRPDAAGPSARRHVILLDTSAAMALQDADGDLLMDEARAMALRYLASVPRSDSVLLVEADGAPAVSVPFTQDRQRLASAIRTARPGWTALDLDAALDLAGGTLRLALDSDGELSARDPRVGETVYVGPGRYEGRPALAGGLPALRFLETGAPEDALGLLSLRAVADPAEAGKWDVAMTARNYGAGPARPRIDFSFDGKPLGHREIAIPSGEDGELRFALRTGRSGVLEARAAEPDAYMANNAATVRIPGLRRTLVQVIGGSDAAFRPLLASGARLSASFVDSTDELDDDAVHVWARGGEGGLSKRAIYFAPPGTPSPVADLRSVRGRPIRTWAATHPLARGVRDRDLMPSPLRVFEPQGGDVVVARTDDGPVVLARGDAGARMVAFGFDLAGEAVRNRLAAPLLFANAVAWLAPDAFRAESVEARPPGAIEVEAPHSERAQIAVRTGAGDPVPWILDGDKVRFFAGREGAYRVVTASRDVTMFLSQPGLPGATWDPPGEVRRGLPAAVSTAVDPWLAWPWLAALAALILAYDWVRFGRGRQPSPFATDGKPGDAAGMA